MIRHLPYSYILLQQEYIFHIHIFISNKKTSSTPIYSSLTRRHLPFPYLLIQQEHIFHSHIQEDMSKEHISCPYSIYHVQTAYTLSQEHIPCPDSIYPLHTAYTMSQEQTCLQSVHIESIRTRHGQKAKKNKILTFSRD